MTAEKLTIYPHPDAEALEVAGVGLLRSVVPRGMYQTGDWAIYIPDGAVLPDDLVVELGLAGRLSGRAGNRVRPRRIRGELSQGLVCRPRALAGVNLALAHADRHNFADALRITKWVPPIPVRLTGEVTGAPELLPWIEIEDIKRHPAMFKRGERVVVTEKIHGTACLYTWADGVSYVSSKGLSKRRQALVRNEENLYWRAISAYDVPAVAGEIATMMNADRVGIFGELYGKGVQDLAYGADATSDKPGYAVFDVRAESPAMGWWLDPDELVNAMNQLGAPLPMAPRLFDGPYHEETLIALADGRESVSGEGNHLREGVVVRPAVERRHPVTGGRAIAKIVSGAYLTRDGGTEFE